MGSPKGYMPFKDLSAWFSSSVHPMFVRQWKEHGGSFATDDKAEFLFSDDAFAADTIRVFREQNNVCLFLSSWILEVVKTKSAAWETPIGQHYLQPHYLIQHNQSGDPYATPSQGKVKWFGSRVVEGRGGARVPARSRLRGSSVEDSQQYLTEGGDATARPVSVAGRSLILDSVEQFLELEKLARNGAMHLVHVEDHDRQHPPLPLTDLDLHSQEYTMRHIR